MTIEDIRSLLSVVATELSDSEMALIDVVIRASVQDKSVTLDELTRALNRNRERPVTGNWVYKCIRRLEKQGFLLINRFSRPICCFTTREMVASSVENMVDRLIARLTARQKSLTERLEMLNSVDIDDLTLRTINYLMGGGNEEQAIARDNDVTSSHFERLTERITHGSTVRVMLLLSDLIGNVSVRRMYEHVVVTAAMHGARVRTIVSHPDHDFAGRKLSSLISRVVDNTRRLGLPCPVCIRHCQIPETSHQMFAVDTEYALMLPARVSPVRRTIAMSHPDGRVVLGSMVRTFEQKWSTSVCAARRGGFECPSGNGYCGSVPSVSA
ncbi:MAG: hypothetical protein QXS20_02695 [Candidatus Thorarchaeota archaeon]